MGARLAVFGAEWRTITTDPWIIDTVESGYRLEFTSQPHQAALPRVAKFNAQLQSICDAEVHSLLEKRAIIRSQSQGGFVSSLFVIPKKSGGHRPIINLKPLNDFIIYEHFKLENLETARSLVRANDWFVKIDLTDAYLTVPIHRDHQKFLKFVWGGETYQFTCLPFGLSSAPRVFTKLLRPVLAHLRRHGIRMVIYLDDILIMNSDRAKLLEELSVTVTFLQRLGFLINVGKSIFTPIQEIEYLGLLLNSVMLEFRLTPDKVKSIIELCSELIHSTQCSLRSVSKILGLLLWAATAIPYALAHFRDLQMFQIEMLRIWNGKLDTRDTLSTTARADLSWWISNVTTIRGRSFSITEPDLFIFFMLFPNQLGCSV